MSRVYFIKPIGMAGPIKIGVSYSPDRRRETLELWSPFPLEIIATVEGVGRTERQFHAMFAAEHVHHEWFTASPALLATIAAIQAGTFDMATLPDPQHLPRREKDLSYITPEWRQRQGLAIRTAHARRRAKASEAAA